MTWFERLTGMTETEFKKDESNNFINFYEKYKDKCGQLIVKSIFEIKNQILFKLTEIP